MRDAEATSDEAVGLGADVVLTAKGFVATALVWDEAVVHLAMFSNERVAAGGSTAQAGSPHREQRARGQ